MERKDILGMTNAIFKDKIGTELTEMHLDVTLILYYMKLLKDLGVIGTEGFFTTKKGDKIGNFLDSEGWVLSQEKVIEFFRKSNTIQDRVDIMLITGLLMKVNELGAYEFNKQVGQLKKDLGF